MATLKFKSKSTQTGRSPSSTVAQSNPPKTDLVMDDRPFHLKYRPTQLSDVVGQKAAVDSIAKVFSKGNPPHAFLFTGPSGTGKTTLARILARILTIPDKSVMEIDAATNSGVADMRQVTDMVQYRALSAGGKKMVIVDEAHALSRQTWQSLLKNIEEPPEHVYWALCTTEPDKVPETIRTRCTSYQLKAVEWGELAELMSRVREEENLDVPDDILEAVARAANGSPRRALVYLQQVVGITNKKEALQLLETGVGEEEQAVQLARMVCGGKGFTWTDAMRIVQALEKDSPEGVRLVVVNYAAAVLKNSKHPEPLLAVLQAFQGPFNPSEKWAPVMLALGTLLYS